MTILQGGTVRRNEHFLVRRGAVRAALRLAPALLLAALLALAAAPGAARAASGRISIESGGVPRTAILVQHRRLKQARRPLVIVLRSTGEKSARLKKLFGLGELAGLTGPVLVYPDPVGGRWSDAGPEAARDGVFIRDLVAKLVADRIIDRRKVFIVGVSNGGFAAFRVICDNAQLFAGAAALITAMPADLAGTCMLSRPVPLMMIVGTADPAIPYAGGKASTPDSHVSVLSADATLAVFGKAAGCAEGRSSTIMPDRDTRDGTRAWLDKLNGCKVPIELLRVEGGGHWAPGRGGGSGVESGRGGPRNHDVESVRLIWDFFRGLGA